MINKITQNKNLSWNPNWVTHQYFLLLQICYLQIVFPTTTDKDGITPCFTNTNWKEAMTPWFIRYN